jgi:hypothetical protein
VRAVTPNSQTPLGGSSSGFLAVSACDMLLGLSPFRQQ